MHWSIRYRNRDNLLIPSSPPPPRNRNFTHPPDRHASPFLVLLVVVSPPAHTHSAGNSIPGPRGKSSRDAPALLFLFFFVVVILPLPPRPCRVSAWRSETEIIHTATRPVLSGPSLSFISFFPLKIARSIPLPSLTVPYSPSQRRECRRRARLPLHPQHPHPTRSLSFAFRLCQLLRWHYPTPLRAPDPRPPATAQARWGLLHRAGLGTGQ